MLRKSVKTFFEMPSNQRVGREVRVSRWPVHTGQDRLRGVFVAIVVTSTPLEVVDLGKGAEASLLDRVNSPQFLAVAKNSFPPRNMPAAPVPL